MRFKTTILLMLSFVAKIQAEESLLNYPIPNSNSEPKVCLYTDTFRENDFKIGSNYVMAEYFTGSDAKLLESFTETFSTPLYKHKTVKPIMDNVLHGGDFVINTYYKPYEFHQAEFLKWMKENKVGSDFLPKQARKYNNYKGNLISPLAITKEQKESFDLKKTLGKQVSVEDGKLIYVQDNRLNPYRWFAPNNQIHHHEASSIFLENKVDEKIRGEVQRVLEDYRSGVDRSKRILLKYRAKVRVEDYRKTMKEYSIFDMYRDGEIERGEDLISAFHKKWNTIYGTTTPKDRFYRGYLKHRFEDPFIQIALAVNFQMADHRYYLQEFMVYNKDYVSTTKGFYNPVGNDTMGEYMYEGGCSGFVGWNRLSTDALLLDGLCQNDDMKVVVSGCEYVDDSNKEEELIERELEGVIDITTFNMFARQNDFFPGQRGGYVDNSRPQRGFDVESTPEYKADYLPSIFWVGFMFEMAGPYKLSIEIEEFDLVIE